MVDLQQALQRHRQGDWAGARRLYQDLLAEDPQNADVCHLLGMTYCDEGRLPEAAEHIRRALDLQPDIPAFHSNLGLVLWKQRQFAVAEAACRRAVQLQPDYAAAHCNLGNVLRDQHRLGEAEQSYRRALTLQPGYVKACSNLGEALRALGRLDEAEATLRRALALKPDYAVAHYNLGSVLLDRDRREEAVVCFQQAVSCRPNYPHAQALLAETLLELQRAAEAEAVCRQALPLVAADVSLTVSLQDRLASALEQLGRWDEAEAIYRRLVQSAPQRPKPHSDLGILLMMLGRPQEALHCFQRAQKLIIEQAEDHAFDGWAECDWNPAAPPEISTERNNAGLARLQLGSWRAGWRDHEFRLTKPARASEVPAELAQLMEAENRLLNWHLLLFERRSQRCPVWQGQPISGRGLLVWNEQGVGDEAMFASLIPDLLAAEARVVIECRARMQPIMARSFPQAEVLVQTEPPQTPRTPLDFHIPLGSVPQYFRNAEDDFPQRAYLRSDPTKVETFRRRYTRLGRGLKVGISWRSGNRRHGRRRSAPLEQWQALLATPDCHFVSLQYGDCSEELATVRRRFGMEVLHDDEVDSLRDLDTFAAQVAALDLVISIDNSTVHFGGALGQTVWTLLPVGPDWRWTVGRDDSLWYPHVRLFRQKDPGDWAPVFAEVARELAGFQGNRSEPLDDRRCQKETYESIWTHEEYREFSPGLASAEKLGLVPRLRDYGVRSLLDAGCGSGKLMQKLLTEYAGEFSVHGFDIASNCLDSFFDGIRDSILTVGCLWDPQDFQQFYDAILCTDVLEHIPAEHIPAVLANFRRCARKVCYLAVALFPDGFGPKLAGEPLHVTVKRPAWWFEQFSQAGFKRDFGIVECNRAGQEMWLHAFLSPNSSA